MSRPTLAAPASLAIICIMSSRTSPLPPGNWWEAFSVTCARAEVDSTTAARAVAKTVKIVRIGLPPLLFVLATQEAAAFDRGGARTTVKDRSAAPIASLAGRSGTPPAESLDLSAARTIAPHRL